MKIGLIHNLYGQFSRGGAEAVVAAQAQELRAAGHEIFIISTKPKKSTGETLGQPRIYYLESNFYNLGQHNWLYRAAWQINNLWSLTKARQIKKILAGEKPALVITHNLMGLGYLTPLIIRGQKIKHEHFLHDIQLLHPSGLMLLGQENKLNSWAAKVYQAITRRLMGSPDQVSSPSRWLLDLHQQYHFFPGSKTNLTPWLSASPIPKTPTLLSPKNSQFKKSAPSKSRSKKLLFVGQIESHKGIFFLIDVFTNLNKSDFALNVIGTGSQLAQAQKRVAELKLSNINFIGQQDAAAIKDWMSESDYLIVPSLCYENSPRVIYEAKLLGRPVIAAKIGGIPEMLTTDDRLFQPGEAADLINKLAALK